MNILYQILIAPIEAVMHVVLLAIYGAIGSYGASILILSLCVNLALLPLYHIAESWQQAERYAQSRLRSKLREFQQAFSGEERFTMIRTLYRQEGYHPIYALRASLGFFIQVPFFIAAYHLLADYQPLQGASFFIFEDLSKPDALLWGINVMPFVMTVVNLFSTLVYTQRLSFPDKIQLWLISFVFLVVLYTSPVALLIYWTFNNIFSLFKNMAYAWLTPTQTTDVGQVVPIAQPYQKHLTSKSGLGTTHSQNRREFFQLCQKILESPYVLALLAGLWPIAFYFSNNWFMFEASWYLFVIAAFSAIIWAALSLFYLVLSWLWKMVFNGNASKGVVRIFVFVSILVMAYLLRFTLMAMVKDNVFVFRVIVLLTASTLAWFMPKIRIFRMNCVLGIICIVHLGMGLNSIISDKFSPTILFDPKEGALRQAIYDQVRFSKRPNVYYIVPDGYPNAEGLKTIFNLDATDFYEYLKLSGFTIYSSTFSNYAATLPSISSSFAMDHHYYRGTVGNFDSSTARKFIVSEQNPVVNLFKNNGYQVHYIHDNQYMFLSGCFVDSCWPTAILGEFTNILVPDLLAGRVNEAITGRLHKDDKHGRSKFSRRVLEHIGLMSEEHVAHFTYIHMEYPGHSKHDGQTSEKLASFRKDYFKQIQISNDNMMRFVQHIITRDPSALIIVNADHGGWGYGNAHYKLNKKEISEGMPDNLVALDHLGALLAIRWPDGASRYDQDLRTNVNLFRYIISYLSESEAILTTKVSDDGFIYMGSGNIFKAIHDGGVLAHMVDVDPVTGQLLSHKR